MRVKKEFLIRPISLILAILIALLIGAVIFAIFGISPLGAYQLVLEGAIGNKHNISESMVILIPLLLAGLGIGFAFKCGLWNIGAEGQLYMGAVGASFAALYIAPPAPLHLVVIILFAFLAGGGWAAIAGVLKAKLGINEILTTLMMNYVAIWITHYFVYGPWRALLEVNPQTDFFPMSAWLPILVPGTRLHTGLLLGIGGAIFMYVVFKYTRLGYAIKVVGVNPKAAQYSGINVSRTMIIAMFISGGLAGLAGMGEVSGIHHYLRNGVYSISPGYGYIAIGVALLGGLNAWGTVLSAIFFGGLLNGASFLRATYGLHAGSVFFLVGLIIMVLLARETLSGKLKTLGILRGRD